jgi:hypothetical protein
MCFERFARSHGVPHIKHYHADNGIFADNLFRKAVAEEGQSLSFCGVNAHWQNGVAERRIRELQELARTMLIHATRRWPNGITANLWPYALRQANNILNATPRLTGNKNDDHRTPLESFSGTAVDCNPKHWHPFGCPVYVLDSNLQAGKTAGKKWTERARVGIYLGQSPQHARNVSIVLNTETGNASPQFHLKVDPTFQTMRTSFGNAPLPTKWQEKCWFTEGSKKGQTRSSPSVRTHVEQPQEAQVPIHDPFPVTQESSEGPGSLEGTQEVTGPTDSQMVEPSQMEEPMVPEGLRRSSRVRRPVQRYVAAFSAIQSAVVPDQAFGAQALEIDSPELTEHPLLAFAASADPDTMYLHQALKEPDKAQFIKAMEEEIRSHTDNKHWTLVPRTDVPDGVPVLPAVWAMKRKRRIATGEV